MLGVDLSRLEEVTLGILGPLCPFDELRPVLRVEVLGVGGLDVVEGVGGVGRAHGLGGVGGDVGDVGNLTAVDWI